MQNNKHRKLNIVVRGILVLLICVFMTPSMAITAHADVATDSLTIKVGYTGMELSEYVKVGKYNWRELANNLSLHKVAYSYFQSKSKTKYNAIVDSAQGFYISDLLSYANIYYGDVRSLKFYVEDHKGIRTTFDRGSLFQTRYYYDDLAGNRTVVYGTRTVTKEVTETIHHDAEYRTETYTETEVVHHDAEYKTETYTDTEVVHHDAEYDDDGNVIKEAYDETVEVEKTRDVLVKEAYDEEVEVEKTRDVLVKEAYDEEVTKMVTEEVPDKSKIIEYTFEKAKKHAKTVQPMLAIEDNWAQFNEEFEHIGPDFSSMNAGNRFRLLFGQTSPTESMTSRSDKYVSCVYVTLDGMPSIGDMDDLNGEYGSHEVSMTVSADNTDIRDALSELMNVKSTNDDVLVITKVKVTPSSKYNDQAKVTVYYDIVGEGDAAITAGVGRNSDPLITSGTVHGKGKPSDPDKPTEKPDDTNTNTDTDTDTQTDTDKTKEEDQKDQPYQDSKKQRGDSSNEKMQQQKAEKMNEELKKKQESVEQINRQGTFIISDNIASQFNAQPQEMIAATEDITEVKIEDNSEEEKEKQRLILILTGLGCLGLGAGGAAAEYISFNIRYRGRRFK